MDEVIFWGGVGKDINWGSRNMIATMQKHANLFREYFRMFLGSDGGLKGQDSWFGVPWDEWDNLMRSGGLRHELTPPQHYLNCPKSSWRNYGCVGVFWAVSWLWMASQEPQMCDLGYLEMIEKNLCGGVGIDWIESPQHDCNHPKPCFGKCDCFRSILSYF